jgi:hypothetical protein
VSVNNNILMGITCKNKFKSTAMYINRNTCHVRRHDALTGNGEWNKQVAEPAFIIQWNLWIAPPLGTKPKAVLFGGIVLFKWIFRLNPDQSDMLLLTGLVLFGGVLCTCFTVVFSWYIECRGQEIRR